MAVPTAPAAGEPIAEAWGDVVHDTAVAQDIQIGTVVVTCTNATTGTAVLTFPRPFASVPTVVVAQASGASAWIAYIAAQTATTFTAAITQKSGATGTGTIGVTWIAIGPRA